MFIPKKNGNNSFDPSPFEFNPAPFLIAKSAHPTAADTIVKTSRNASISKNYS